MKRGNKMIIIILFILYVLLSSGGLVLFKLGVSNGAILKIFGFNITISLKMILGIICYGCSFLLWLYITSNMNLTFAMPLSVALVNTLVIVESCIFLKEKITLAQGIGIFIVILGVSIMTFGKK